MQEYGGVLADGIEQHRLLALGHSLADDVDAFGLELFEVRELPGATESIWRCQCPLGGVDGRQHHIHGVDPLWLGYAGSEGREGGLAGMEPALRFLVLLPPPSARALGLAGGHRAGARFTADRGEAAVMKWVVGNG